MIDNNSTEKLLASLERLTDGEAPVQGSQVLNHYKTMAGEDWDSKLPELHQEVLKARLKELESIVYMEQHTSYLSSFFLIITLTMAAIYYFVFSDNQLGRLTEVFSFVLPAIASVMGLAYKIYSEKKVSLITKSLIKSLKMRQ